MNAQAGRKARSLATSSRQWGTGTAAGRPARKVDPDAAEKREARIRDAVDSVVQLFESDDLPARIAQTVIARQEGTSPMVNWSLSNQLIAILNGTTDARGYRQWQQAGRHVEKGSRAFYILGPKQRTITNVDKSTGEEVKRTFLTGFVGIPVFRYEDTDGDPLETATYEPATFPPLYDVAERLGVNVTYAPFVRDFRGYYAPGSDRIVLCSHDVRTFFHELGHAAHARVLAERGDSLRGGQDELQEIVAELAAATLCRLYDFDGYLAHSADYIATYGKDSPGRAAMRVLADVQAVLLLILEAHDGAMAEVGAEELTAAA